MSMYTLVFYAFISLLTAFRIPSMNSAQDQQIDFNRQKQFGQGNQIQSQPTNPSFSASQNRFNQNFNSNANLDLYANQNQQRNANSHPNSNQFQPFNPSQQNGDSGEKQPNSNNNFNQNTNLVQQFDPNPQQSQGFQPFDQKQRNQSPFNQNQQNGNGFKANDEPNRFNQQNANEMGQFDANGNENSGDQSLNQSPNPPGNLGGFNPNTASIQPNGNPGGFNPNNPIQPFNPNQSNQPNGNFNPNPVQPFNPNPVQPFNPDQSGQQNGNFNPNPVQPINSNNLNGDFGGFNPNMDQNQQNQQNGNPGNQPGPVNPLTIPVQPFNPNPSNQQNGNFNPNPIQPFNPNQSNQQNDNGNTNQVQPFDPSQQNGISGSPLNPNNGNFEKQTFGNTFSTLPDFVQQSSLEAKQQFSNILAQTNQTISQRDAQLAQWAQQNNCTDQYNAFVAQEQSATQNLQSKVVTTLVEMQLAFQSLFALQKNTSATTNEIVSTIEQTLSAMSPDKRTLLNQLLRIANGDPLSPVNPSNPGNNGNNGNNGDSINPNGGQNGGTPIQPPVWQPNGNFGVNVLHVS